MKATTKIIRTVTLELTYAEAEWLKEIMQNPIHASTALDEEDYDRKNRIALFDALSVPKTESDHAS